MDTKTRLTLEVIQRIVDELGANGRDASSRAALRSLTLVSTTICMLAYEHPFRELNLVLFVGMLDDCTLIPICQRIVERLQHILEEGANFSGLTMLYFLRAVSITILCENPRQLHQSAVFLPELSGILQALHEPNHGITTFRLEINQPARGILDNPQLVLVSDSKPFSPTSYEALLSLWRSPKLTTLQLVGTLMASTVLHGMDLQNIYLQRVCFQEADPPAPVNHLLLNTIPHPSTITLILGQSQWEKRSLGPFQMDIPGPHFPILYHLPI